MKLFANARSQRALIWIAIVTAIMYGIGYTLTGFFPPPAPTLDSGQVVELYSQHNLRLRIGVVICLVFGGFSLPWSLALGVQMSRDETGVPIWAILQVLAGVLGVIPFMLPPLFWGVAAFSITRDPQATLLMHELAFLTFLTPVTFFALQALPVVAICFIRKVDPANSAFPRWLGYLTVWTMASVEVGVLAQLFKTGPFAWNGLFIFWLPVVIFTIWFTVICRCLLGAIHKQNGQLD